ncbi:MAG TPA: YcaO-like family protein, partial [Streptosporangiaceae bacterium]|nr:YcaO-like family protein [Streptosporangiaceae bacterium]
MPHGRPVQPSGDRSVPPDVTLERFTPIGRSLGITRLADVTGLDIVGLPVFLAIRPTARSLVTSIGKGITRPAAKAGALMESIETWHAEHVALATWHATADEILAAGETALDVRSLPAAIDGTVHRSQVRSWLPGRDLRRGEAVWVPEEIVSLNFVADAMPEPSLARNSNGLASGNDLTE